jgi:hypothetical protein
MGRSPRPPEPRLTSLLDELRRRLGEADSLNGAELHSFKVLMADYAASIDETWYWEAFERLEAQGQLTYTSRKLDGGDACGRLSAEGRWYLRMLDSTPP